MAQKPVDYSRARLLSNSESKLCSVHGDELKKYCATCKKMLCIDCIMEEDHKCHVVQKIDECATLMRNRLRERESVIRSECTGLIQEKIQKCSEMKLKINTEAEKLISEINEHAKYLTENIEATRMTFVRDVERHKKQKEKEILDAMDKYQEQKDSLESKLEVLASNIKDYGSFEIIDLDHNIEMAVGGIRNQIIDSSAPIMAMPKFKKNAPKEETMRSLFGNLKEEAVIADMKLTVKSSFQKDTAANPRPVGTIAVQKDGLAWMSVFRDVSVQLVDDKGIMKRVINVDGKITSVSINSNGELLVCCQSDTCLRIINKNSEIMKFADMKPLIPTGISASKSGHVFVGLVDKMTYDVTSESKRLVVKLDNGGKVRSRFSLDANHQAIFNVPFRICENENGDICVIDGTGLSSGRLLVLSKAGELKLRYTGSRTLRSIFDPRAVCCTSHHNILVCDLNNHNVHLLNSQGECLAYIDSEKELIGPFSIDLDGSGVLWVGGAKGDVQCLEYEDK